MKKKSNFVFLALFLIAGCQQDTDAPAADCVEKPNNGRACTLQYDPVCGCNDKTYSNACAAESVGILRYRQGECGK